MTTGLRPPCFFTRHRRDAMWFAGRAGENGEDGVILACRVRMRRPFLVLDEAGANAWMEIARRAGLSFEEEPYFWAPIIAEHSPYEGSNELDLIYVPAMREALIREGYDGVHAWDTLENTNIEVWITLRVDQAIVKSSVETR